MLDSNTILGITYNLGLVEYKHAIISQNLETWPCAAPIVFAAGPELQMAQEMHSQLPTLSLFPPNRHTGGRCIYNTPGHMVKPVDLKPLSENHKVITANEFDLSKSDRLLECIHDTGGISFIIEWRESRQKAALALERFTSLFKYNSLFYHNMWSNRMLEGSDDKYICVITMLDIPYCVPLFNMRKVDGIGLSFIGATVEASKRHGQLNTVFKADILLTNYEDNVFVIDGATLHNENPMQSSLFSEFASMAGTELSVGSKKPTIKAGASKKSKMPYAKGGVVYTGSVSKEAESIGDWGIIPQENSSEMVELSTEMEAPSLFDQHDAEVAGLSMADDEAPPSFPDDLPEVVQQQKPTHFATENITWKHATGGSTNTFYPGGGTSNNSED